MFKKKNQIILFIILFSYFLILMDNSIIFTSTVKIAQSLHMDKASLSWVSNAYTITFGGFLLLAGRLGDLLGRKRIFLSGLVLFGISSLCIGLAQNSIQIITFRAIQGIGSAIIAPTTLALLMDHFEGKERSKAISYYGATAGIGSSIGLLLGGWLTSTISWRSGFLINVPFTIILIILTLLFVKSTTVHRVRIDFIGAILSVIAIMTLVYGMTNESIIAVIIGFILLIIFVIFERKLPFALMPMSLFKNKVRTGAYVGRFIFMMAMLSYWFILPQMMQHLYHYTPLQAGIAFLTLTIINFIAALYLPYFTEKLGNTNVLLLGQIILTLGLIVTTSLNPLHGYWLAIGIPMLLVGLGQGWLLAPITSAGIHEVDASLSGAASGMTNTMHQLGGPIGLSIIVFFTSNITHIIHYYHVVMWLIVIYMIIGFIVLWMTQRQTKSI
ncbi:MFS transporter [Staphylococcus haemolyticus]|uniref:MFS transporter n=1 Tax=Staphylococcus haemolyticus TaxID=1283 RepID=UPI00069F318F|nr:MFS transporter [Staphylococcus haemolyticus]MBC3104308.1 MFS transporter [Staphylococcus haemolyticus]MCT1687475.1 MFS transporter [Staphylococcus haemolyticus]MCT1755652.1 MFS transporter [Staphylococcus haemolyticus]MDT3948087.1 MFS transporter [Staphylococcus haemolyticus]MEB6745846.1 MFS transporter [Staphylococcus haemolyticus]